MNKTIYVSNNNTPLLSGGVGGRLRVGILGAAGYTGGELIRVLLNHPEAEIVFANSESNAGNLVSDVHEGLIGDTDLKFTDEMPFDKVDVVFFCFGHGKSEQFLKEHTIPENVKIIDLAQDFRIKGDHDYVYGLPEINKEDIAQAQHVANPGCFATCIQVALLPAANLNLLKEDVAVNAITGSTGAGQKPGATTHFSWRNNNLSIYKPFQHQHIAEIRQSIKQVQGYLDADIDFIPYRGDFARGIFCTAVIKTPALVEDVIEGYKDFYADAAFTHYSDKPIDLKEGEIEDMLATANVKLTGSQADKLEKVYLQLLIHFSEQCDDQFVTARRSGYPKVGSSLLPFMKFPNIELSAIPRRFVIGEPVVTDIMYDIKKAAYEVQGFKTLGTNSQGSQYNKGNAPLNTERVWQDKNAPQWGTPK